MKIVITSTGVEYELAVEGFYDNIGNQLNFRVLKDNKTLDEIYTDFTGDTSSLKFMYPNGEMAWAKNGYTELKDFHPMPNQKIGKDSITGSDKYADVVEIVLSAGDYDKRISSAEDAIKKLTVSNLTVVKVMDDKVKAVETAITNANDTVNALKEEVNTSKSTYEQSMETLLNDTNTSLENLIGETRSKLNQYMNEIGDFMANTRTEIQSLIAQVQQYIAGKDENTEASGEETVPSDDAEKSAEQ